MTFLKDIIEKPITGEWGDEGEDVKVLRTTNFTNLGVLDLSEVVKRNISSKKVEQKKLLKGDIIIEKSGGSPKQPVGRVVFFNEEGVYLCNNFTSILRPKKDKVFPRYLHYLLYGSHRFGVTGMFQNKTTGIINLQLPRYINKLEIPLPDLDTQKRIAQILDDAAALRDKTKQLLEEYDKLAQSIFLDMFGDPVINPKGWQEQKMKVLTSKIGSGSTPKGGKDAYKMEGISLIRSLNIHDNCFKNKDLAFIDDAQAAKLKNVIIEENDVLLNITGASVARCAIVPKEILPARVNQHVSILRVKREELNPVFLLHLVISPNVKVKLLGIGTRNGATREAITKEQLQNFEIPIPPIDLQNQFADKIALIEQQKELAKQELKEAEDLFNCLLQKAFKGELV
ncbi:restriction endonuclease subunit S [Mangrovimonas aestuarii]|uniref:restriction endonuclease subunit S n=1 Tax=Mangrovimonas aestuarii TaxID=3018443 RepID=UPI0023782795|nr:restriction endonuclease subunit S [Mangrovimonas aestuarii]